MNRRLPCLLALALLSTGGLPAQTLTYSPLNPQPGGSVNFTVSLFSDCFSSLEDASFTPPASGNGSIRLTITHACACVTGPPVSFDEEVGPLAVGTYDVELYQRFRGAGGACCDGDCSPPDLLSASTLTVSQNQAVVSLRTEPAQPVAGQPLTVRFDTFCPFVWKTPTIQPSGNETLILIDQDPEAPQPAAPCTADPDWPASFPLAGLAAGTYRLRVRMGESSATLETVAEAVFAASITGPALSLHQGRFLVQADWSAPGFGEGSAQGVTLTEESGYFTFFSPTNVELIAKVLDGCLSNQRYWVFLAGLTNVAVTIQVEDTLTGQRETYANPLGRPFQLVVDTSRFATCP